MVSSDETSFKKWDSSVMRLPCLGMIMATVFVLLTGCDPVVIYDIERDDGKKSPVQVVERDSVEFTLPGLMELTGSASLLYYVSVKNNSSATVVISAGKLETGDWVIPADLPGEGELIWRTVEPGESKEIPFLFRLLPAGGTAVDMGNEVDIRWQYLLDNDLHLLETKLIRKAG